MLFASLPQERPVATTTVVHDTRVHRGIHPVHAVFLASMLPPFLGALLSDIAYANTYDIQWQNFSSWLIVGGMVFCGITLVLAIVGLFRGWRDGRGVLYVLAVAATFVLGFINALVHAKDAWAMMPEGPILSAIVLLLALLATWLGFAGYRTRGGA